MANELVLNMGLAYTKNAATVNEAIVNLQISVSGNGLVSLTAYSAPTSDTALPLGSVTAPCYCFIKNTDATNYVQIKSGVAGTSFSKLLPGQFCVLPLDPGITAPSAQAHTAPCVLTYCIFDL